MKTRKHISTSAFIGHAYLPIMAIVILLLTASCHTSKKVAYTAKPKAESTTFTGKNDGGNDKANRNDNIVITNGNLPPQTLALLKEADKWLGTKYRYGGDSKKGVDCSGLTMRVYDDALGIKIPRNSAKQQEYCETIRKEDLVEGDLIFFSTGRKGSIGHVGLYIGNGKMIHSSSSKGVIISSLTEDYYRRTYHSSGRVSQYWAMVANSINKTDAIKMTPTTPTVTATPTVMAAAKVTPPSEPDKMAPQAKEKKAPKKKDVTVASKKVANPTTIAVAKIKKTTPPPVTKASIEEARRKVLDEIIVQKADSITSSELLD